MPFADYADFDDCVNQNQDNDSPEGFCAWLHYQTVGEWPSVTRSTEKKDVETMPEKSDNDLRLTAPIVFKDEDKRTVYGAVLIPGVPDADDDVVGTEKIEEVAHKFMEKYRAIDVQHGLFNGGIPLESYLAPQDLLFGVTTVPKGSWILCVRVDEEQWPRVNSGELNGFSIMAVPGVAKQAALKRVTLRDLGPDWEVVSVSLVDNPAIPMAKFIAIKEEKHSMLEKVKEALTGSAEKSGREISDTNFKALKSVWEVIGGIIERAKKERATKSELKSEEEEGMEDEIEPKEGIAEEKVEETPKENTPKAETPEALKKEDIAAMIKSEMDAFEQRMMTVLQEALKGVGKSAPKSDSIKGQDGFNPETSERTRDLHGFKIKKQGVK